MPEPLNASFIPKRNTSRPNRQNHTERVFLGTLLIQILFFATLLATLGVFVYEKNLKEKLESEVISFNNEISSFSEEEMKRVIGLDNRMKQVSGRLAHTASVVSIFEAMEVATLQSVQIKSLKLVRTDDTQFSLESNMETDTFDSVMFQRGVLERDDNLTVTKMADLKLVTPVRPDGSTIEQDKVLQFKANLAINTSDVPHKGGGVPIVSEEIVPDEATTSEAVNTEEENSTLSDEEESNQENI
ncbi:MAG: hypothetical protein KBC78_00415 [Candidatus Pacebacteria bacterium]|nr:hypothetical protein [Candidatus Paceibacterota bacterium]